MKDKTLSLNDKILIAALKLSKGDARIEFKAEDLLVQVWKEDKPAFGLRGYEENYPDSNNLYVKLMGKKSLVRLGYLKKVGEKTYTLTEAGLSIASSLKPTDEGTKLKIDRQLHDAVIKIINHQIFRDWLIDKNKPNKFRDAGYIDYRGMKNNKDAYIFTIYRKDSLLTAVKLLKPYLKHRKRVKDMLMVEKNINDRNLKYNFKKDNRWYKTY